jgi:hypothetical protein
MRFIEHIIEPAKLLLAWQSSDEAHRTRYIVAELTRVGDEINLTYLPGTEDFAQARSKGFEAYPAFQDTGKNYSNVLDAFMRRLPPRTRGDFPQYLEGLRLHPNVKISNFALLGYSGAKLLSDGFSIIHPFNNAYGPCQMLVEAAGYRHIQNMNDFQIHVGDPVNFSIELNDVTHEPAIRIDFDGSHIGYINRALITTFSEWIEKKRIDGAWIEKLNGTPGKPAVYLYVKVSA